MDITCQELNELFEYSEGKIYWKRNGSRAGTKKASGYRQVSINNKLYYEHRIIFMMHHGYLPVCTDHKDGDKNNNTIENLREATFSQNSANIKKRNETTSGIKSVFKNKKGKPWRVRIAVKGDRMDFGSYDDLELAELVADEARDKYHKDFARNS